MKKKFYTPLVVVVAIAITALAAGCHSGSDSATDPFAPLDPPLTSEASQIIQLTPASGPAGTVVTLELSVPSSGTCAVDFDGASLSYSHETHAFTVPADATVGAHDVGLICDGVISNDVAFTVIAVVEEEISDGTTVAEDEASGEEALAADGSDGSGDEVATSGNDNYPHGIPVDIRNINICDRNPEICRDSLDVGTIFGPVPRPTPGSFATDPLPDFSKTHVVFRPARNDSTITNPAMAATLSSGSAVQNLRNAVKQVERAGNEVTR